MAKNKFSKGNYWTQKLFECFNRLKMKSLKLNFLRYITRFIMFINYIMTIDIIFQYKRNFLELHSIIYF